MTPIRFGENTAALRQTPGNREFTILAQDRVLRGERVG
jgi:hypothetical protein